MQKKYKYNLYKIAEYMGVRHQAVYKWFLGQAMPRADKLIKLAEYLNISIEELLNEFSKSKL